MRSDPLRHVVFRNGATEIAADLRLPDRSEADGGHAAIVLVTPGSSVKEQIGANYAARLAECGFITLTFDPSHQGRSGGEPRDLEDPATRIEDIRCAIDYLMTLSFIDERRVGLLGICAGGGYAVSAAKIDHRVRALGTVVAVNIGRAFRQASPAPSALADTLGEIGRQRTAEVRGAAARREPWIPDTPEAARAQGIDDPDVLEAVDYYRTPRGHDARSTNRIYFTGNAPLLDYDAFHLIEELLVQPVHVIVGGRMGTNFSYADGRALFERAPNRERFVVVAGAGHYEMYDKPEYIDQAVASLDGFFKRHLTEEEQAR